MRELYIDLQNNQMPESFKIALTAVGGNCVFVIGQINSPGDDSIDRIRTKASDQLRQLSCELKAKTHCIPLYRLWSKLGFVIKGSWKNNFTIYRAQV